MVGIPSLLQFAVPAVGRALERDPAATLTRGEWWRPLTVGAAIVAASAPKPSASA